MRKKTKFHSFKAPATFAFFALIVFYIFLPKLDIFDLDYSKSFYDAEGELLKITLSHKDNYRVLVQLAEVNPDYIKAILLYEDKYFYYHFGVNPFSLARSFWQSFIVGDRVYGASTISMQVARMKFAIQSNNIIGKLTQIFRAIQIERHYSKDEILAAYINLLPFGGNIYGVETASRIYFKKSALDINLLEALNLAIIPQNPTKRAPKILASANNLDNFTLTKFENNEILQAQKHLLYKWQKKYGYDNNLKNFIGLNLAVGDRSSLPNFAPHFINYLNTLDLTKFKGKIDTSLDLNLQLKLEKILSAYVAEKSRYGIKNAVALVVNSKTMAVESLIGSADFYNENISGQVDGTAALRSPGSTLKPFAYALALEQGLIHPLSMLEDVPSFYGAYEPVNFDSKYRGLLSATQALVYSRNLPAVYLTSKLKSLNLYEFLQLANSNLKENSDYYGMGLVLGGVDLSMRKLTELYATLVNDGFYAELNYLKNTKPKFLRQVLTPEASFLTLDMLRKNKLPFINSHQEGFYAWKTGTSYAFKDAWTLGIVGNYIVAIWLGNFDASANQNLVGASMATPLWFRIAQELRTSGRAKQLEKPTGALDIRQIEVCATSGDLAGRYCPKLAKTWIINGISPLQVEDVYRKIKIDKKTGLRLCDYEIAAPSSYYEKVFEFWSLDIQRLYHKAGISLKSPPAYKEACVDYANSTQDLKIILPDAKTRVALNLKEGEAKILFKGLARDAKKLYWFLDEKFIGTSLPNQVLVYKAKKAGTFKVKLLDDLARTKSTTLNIENLAY